MYKEGILWCTISFVIIQMLILFFQIINCFARPKDKSRLRFLLLILAFVIFNLFSKIFPIINHETNSLPSLIFCELATLILYFYFLIYVYKDFNFKPPTIKFIILTSLTHLIILTFLTLNYLTNIFVLKKIFTINRLILFVLLGFNAFSRLFSSIFSKNEILKYQANQKSRVLAFVISILILLIFPITQFFVKNHIIEQTLINFGFFSISLIYFENYINQSKSEFEIISNLEIDTSFLKIDSLFIKNGLTKKEVEISKFILKDYKYSEIGNKLYITSKTVSKHASNIFKKFDVKKKEDFINLLRNYQK